MCFVGGRGRTFLPSAVMAADFCVFLVCRWSFGMTYFGKADFYLASLQSREIGKMRLPPFAREVLSSGPCMMMKERVREVGNGDSQRMRRAIPLAPRYVGIGPVFVKPPAFPADGFNARGVPGPSRNPLRRRGKVGIPAKSEPVIESPRHRVDSFTWAVVGLDRTIRLHSVFHYQTVVSSRIRFAVGAG